MKKKDIEVEWTVVDDEEAWLVSQQPAHSVTASPQEAPTRTANRKEVLIAILAVALILSLAGGWAWQRQQQAALTANELQTALMQGPPVQLSASETGATGSGSGRAASGVSVGGQVNNYQRWGDRVMVDVTVEVVVEGKTLAYRETRFFRKEGEHWLRIDPDPKLMGPVQTLKFAHFIFHYPAADAAAVYEAAPRVEKLYSKVSSDLGVPSADATSIYTIEVATQGPYTLKKGGDSQGGILVPSPTLLSAPLEMTADDLLYQAVVYPLARRAVSKLIASHSVQWQSGFARRQRLADALALWELWEDGGALATGREDVVRWLYTNAQSEATHQQLPDRYDLLCQNYQIWGILPSDLSIPLTCTEADKLAQSDEHYATLPLSVQAQLYPEQATGMLAGAFDNIATSETLVEYVVATYGRQKLPLFLERLGNEASLQSVVPALFGVSTDLFEAGWQAYVAERYHVK